MSFPLSTHSVASTKLLSSEAISQYHRDGFHFPVKVMPEAAARVLRDCLESYEKAQGGPLDQAYRRHKVHLLFTWLWQLVRNPNILDAVEDLIGPNILCWSSSFFIKEAHDPSFVSWHQDATYWGLSTDEVVTAWVALSPSTIPAGAMRVVPRSHLTPFEHRDTFAPNNMLTRGQEVMVDIDDAAAVDLVLRPGEMSLHHVGIVHGSEPNRSDDRRIGLAIRYIPTHVKQIKGPQDGATLVRGVDEFGHFDRDLAPETDFSPTILALHHRIFDRHSKLAPGKADASGKAVAL